VIGTRPAMSRKVLIITYYWPPGGGSGVQRWLKFSKYLREFGWEPIIYTPDNPEMAAVDTSLDKDIPSGITVLKTPIFEPYGFYKVLTRRKEPLGAGFVTESGKVGTLELMSRWIRGNFFIPDARKFWIRPSVKFLTNWLKSNPVDAIVSTGPPHSMHLIAREVKKHTGLPWLADFRDPWTNIDFYDELRLSRPADRKHHELEASVVKGADRVTVVSPTMEREFREDHLRDILTLTNGFDEDDISVDNVLPVDDKRFGIAHIGTMNPSRNPVGLWTAISELITNDESLLSSINLRLIGRVDHSIKTAVHQSGLQSITDYIEYVPHDQVVAWQQGASVLLLLLNQSKNAHGILPGKFFEYLATGRPILCLGPTDSDAASILKETGSGVCLEYDDVLGIKSWIQDQLANQPVESVKSENIGRFTRRSLTARLAGILDDMIKQ
jgi:glycosyltransferase involved in cell wall biosynthesis